MKRRAKSIVNIQKKGNKKATNKGLLKIIKEHSKECSKFYNKVKQLKIL